MTRWKKHLITDNTPIWFGIHEGTKMKDLPKQYLEWLAEHGFRACKKYAKDKLNKI